MDSDAFLAPYADRRRLRTRALALFGLGRDASSAEIRRAFLRLAMRVHPDRGGSHRAYYRVVNAYLVLTRPDPGSYPLGPEPDLNAARSAPMTDGDYRNWWLDRFFS